MYLGAICSIKNRLCVELGLVRNVSLGPKFLPPGSTQGAAGETTSGRPLGHEADEVGFVSSGISEG